MENSIGERIKKRRRELDLSAEELVYLIASKYEKGISLPTIYRYEKETNHPTSKEIVILCDVLNVSADWLIFGRSWNEFKKINCSNCKYWDNRFSSDGYGWCNINLPPKYHIEFNYKTEPTFTCDLHKSVEVLKDKSE